MRTIDKDTHHSIDLGSDIAMRQTSQFTLDNGLLVNWAESPFSHSTLDIYFENDSMPRSSTANQDSNAVPCTPLSPSCLPPSDHALFELPDDLTATTVLPETPLRQAILYDISPLNPCGTMHESFLYREADTSPPFSSPWTVHHMHPSPPIQLPSTQTNTCSNGESRRDISHGMKCHLDSEYVRARSSNLGPMLTRLSGLRERRSGKRRAVQCATTRWLEAGI
ncbi:hypothetical protein BGZ63DRAFT_102613 [Mariannaea sp. PMI_226]|nr:hypothetical protein BGZ63DRAFT_102613 [Mariannaea sp. PMI_226]